MKTCLPLLIAVGVTTFAQTGAKQVPQTPPPQAAPALAPELAPLAARHRADLATLEQQRTAALAAKLPFYLTPLDTAEKNALAQSKLDAVAAIQLERDAVKGGKIGDLIAAPFPEKLPAGLKSARESLFDSYKRIEADVLKLRQKVDADYVRALAALQQRAAGKAELLAQIKAESDAVLGKPVTKPEGEVEVATKTGKVINGNFTEADASGFPVGWKIGSGSQPKEYKIVQENGRSHFHCAMGTPDGNLNVMQIVEIPRLAKEVELKFQVRGQLSSGDRFRYLNLRFMDAAADPDKSINVNPPKMDFTPETAWKSYGFKIKLDGKTKPKTVRIELNYGIKSGTTGYLDWSRVELHFK